MPKIDMSSDDSELAVMQEVWNTNNIETRTELSGEQIENINKLMTLSKLFGNKIIEQHTNTFMKLQKSKDRKSMKEFIDIVRAKREDFVDKGKGFMNGLMG